MRHCLDRSISLNNCHQSIYICNQKSTVACFWAIWGVFVPVAQTLNCGNYFAFLKVCRNSFQPMSSEILINILITPHIHSPCHIFPTVQQFLVMKKLLPEQTSKESNSSSNSNHKLDFQRYFNQRKYTCRTCVCVRVCAQNGSFWYDRLMFSLSLSLYIYIYIYIHTHTQGYS